jgi:glycosyltransferase involved in cell wall biosynthesis
MPSFRGGGAERVMLTLASGLVREVGVDIVVAQKEGPYLDQLPDGVRVVDLAAHRVVVGIPALYRYLRRERPHAMLSALMHVNVVAVWTRALARVDTRLVLSEHNTATSSAAHAVRTRERVLPAFARLSYRRADAIVAVSAGAADDLAAMTGLDRARITVIYNPVVTPSVFTLASRPLEHEWFQEGQPPVILGAGRLTAQKDFPTLIRAFAVIRQRRGAAGPREAGARARYRARLPVAGIRRESVSIHEARLGIRPLIPLGRIRQRAGGGDGVRMPRRRDGLPERSA